MLGYNFSDAISSRDRIERMSADAETEQLVLLRDLARHIRTHADQSARRHGMTWAQWMIIARLERQPGLSQNELAAITEVAPISIARLVDRLEAQGVVERCADPEDRRIWRLQLTPAAGPILREIQRLRAKLHSVMTKGIDRAVLDAMTTGLRQMKQNVSMRRLAKASA
jgi:MarR family transcriptional regulator, transcriptional regulator for hemolysin